MSGLLSVLRLLLRPLTLWNLGVVVSICGLLIARGVYAARGGLTTFVGASAAEIEHSVRLSTGLVTVLVPAGLGGVVAWAVFEFLLMPLAPLLPRARRRFATGLLASGLVIAGATTWWCVEQTGEQRPLVHFGYALLGFGFGVWASDPLFRLRPFLSWGSLALLIAAAAYAPELLLAGERSPVLVPLPALLLGTALVLLPLRKSSLRARVLDPRCAADLAYATDELRRRYGQLLSPNATARVRWSGAKLATDRDWLRAARYESSGSHVGGWWGGTLAGACFWSVVLAAVAMYVGPLAQQGHAPSPLLGLHATLFGPDALGREERRVLGRVLPLCGLVMPCWMVLYHLANPLDFFAAPLVPLGRERRARLVWRASLHQNLGMIAALALVLGVTAEVVRRLVGWSVPRGAGLPEFLSVLLLMAVLNPIAQWVRIRYVEARLGARLGLPVVVPLALAGLLVYVPALAWSLPLREVREELPAWAELAILLALFALAQRLWRRLLTRHYRTSDLGS